MDDALTLTGRVAIITGAGNGLGRAESLALARAGARVVLNDLPGEAVEAVAREIRADGGQAVVAAGDIGEWSAGEQLMTAGNGGTITATTGASSRSIPITAKFWP